MLIYKYIYFICNFNFLHFYINPGLPLLTGGDVLVNMLENLQAMFEKDYNK